MEKVKVSKEVFDALESFKLRKGEDFKLHLNYCVISGSLSEGEKALYSKVKISELVDIAYCGYELELTAEEKLLERVNLYSKGEGLLCSDSYILGRKSGILECLEILKIKIKGINE